MVIDPLFKFSLSSFILLMINRLKSIFSVCVCVYIYEFLRERRETETEIERKRDREKMRKVEGALLIPHVLTSSLFCLHYILNFVGHKATVTTTQFCLHIVQKHPEKIHKCVDMTVFQ